MLTHGIYGAGNNWRSIARKLTEQRPEWGVVLVDLRQHGRSEPGEPPHTIAACAEDLRALASELGDIDAIAGHSFGGKVALATRPLVAMRQIWVLDASPSRRDRLATGRPGGNAVVRILELMERMPARWPGRDDFVAAVVGDGHDAGLARWLAMNLVPAPGASGGAPSSGYQLRLDLTAMREMITSYHATDLWDVLEAPGDDVELVVADQAPTFDAADRGRLAAAPPHVHVHHVAAGHWLHIDAAAAVVELFASRLP